MYTIYVKGSTTKKKEGGIATNSAGPIGYPCQKHPENQIQLLSDCSQGYDRKKQSPEKKEKFFMKWGWQRFFN